MEKYFSIPFGFSTFFDLNKNLADFPNFLSRFVSNVLLCAPGSNRIKFLLILFGQRVRFDKKEATLEKVKAEGENADSG